MSGLSRAGVAVFLAILVVVGVIIAVVGLGTDGSTAITVGDTKLSQQTLNDDLRAVAENERLSKAIGAQNVSVAPGSVNADATVSLGSLWIQAQLARRILDRKGEHITANDRSTGHDSLASTAFGPPLRTFPRGLRTRLTDEFAALAALDRVAPDASTATRLLRREAKSAGVSVDPVYGLYHPKRVQVGVYPTPATPSGSGSSGSSASSG